jgi:predicted glycoside hydrolase/deacetylase ChbG (UPF0249 family)
MTRRLIVNADGFGFGPGATQGVFDALAGGFISSVSVNANFPEAERVEELVRRYPAVSIGVHLNPMVGKPCLPAANVPSLIDDNGDLHGNAFPGLLRRGRVARAELKAELLEQIRKVRNWAGDRLTHLDSQGNRHLDYFDLFLEIARETGIFRMRNNASTICLESPRPRLSRWKTYLVRPHVWLAHVYRKRQMRRARTAGMRMADSLVTVGYGGVGNKTREENWIRILRHLPPGTHEVYCHPAHPDETLRRWSYYQEDRAAELAVLRGPVLRREAERLKVELIPFDAL